MTPFVLHLGYQNGLAFEAGSATDPVALRQHPHYFAVGMLANLAQQRFAIGLWHPVLGLDLAILIEALVKAFL